MVPAEIVDHILGFLHSDGDYIDLETCSNVFPRLVERRLYSRITFSTDSPSSDIPVMSANYIVDPTRFSQTLIDCPHVANYVRSVTIVLGPRCPFPPELAAISSNLSNLPRIRSIALNARSWLSWHILDYRFRTAFRNCIISLSIKEVSISRVEYFPLDTFEDCKNLERLQLFYNFAGCDAVSTSQFPRLSYLGLQSQDDVPITRVVSWMKSNTLRSLSLQMSLRIDLHRFRTLLEACAATLVNLELNHRCCVDNNENLKCPPVLQFPLLERIIIRSDILLYSENSYSSLPLLAPFLSSIRPLSIVTLCTHLQLYVPTRTTLLGLHWSDLAAFLVLPVFHHPLHLSVYSARVSLTDIISSFNENLDLKRLYESGGLVINAGHEYLYS